MSRLAEELVRLSRNAPQTGEVAGINQTVANRVLVVTIAGDAAVIFGVLLLSFWIRFRTNFPFFGGIDHSVALQDYAAYIIVGALVLMLILSHYRFYEFSQVLRYRQVSFLIIRSCTMWLVTVLCVTRLFDFHPPLSRAYGLLTAFNLGIVLLFWRLLLNRILSLEKYSRHLRERILFVGWNDLSERLTKFVLGDTNPTYTLVGCIPPLSGHYEKDPPQEIPHVAAYRDLVSMLQAHSIDMVILADRTASMQEIDELATVCEKELVQFKVIPSYFQILVTGLSLQTISGIPILGVSHLPLDRPINCVLKRTVDIVGAIVGLILSVPIIVIFGSLVYWESPGPIFYRPRRLGRHGVEFDMIKIRSMRLNADQEGSGHWTLKDDPRRLRIGGFIRKWNIDELPQFWNVLKGDMSLVGPRPESVVLINSFKHEIAHYHARHVARPGLTGWAAVNGLRGDTDLSERIRCDLYYLENWNFFLDFQIMFLTFFRRKGAG
jgi:exopolysaccharide biosynthesis polyprenyl glycosylphosphotransferase